MHLFQHTHAIIIRGISTKQAGAAESKQEKCFWLTSRVETVEGGFQHMSPEGSPLQQF